MDFQVNYRIVECRGWLSEDFVEQVFKATGLAERSSWSGNSPTELLGTLSIELTFSVTANNYELNQDFRINSLNINDLQYQ